MFEYILNNIYEYIFYLMLFMKNSNRIFFKIIPERINLNKQFKKNLQIK